MLEKVDLSKEITKEEKRKQIDELLKRLGFLQRRCKEEKIPIIILFEGLCGAGKGTQISELIQGFDPRGFKVYSIGEETEEERFHPFLWRFWIKLPKKGHIAILDRSWYQKLLKEGLKHKNEIAKKENHKEKTKLYGSIKDTLFFEEQLQKDGMVVIKFFLHISKKEQAHRLEKLKEREETAWRVTKEAEKENKKYKQYLTVFEEILEKTDASFAPWNIIEAENKEFATIKIIKLAIYYLEQALLEKEKKKIDETVKEKKGKPISFGVLSSVDLSKTLNKDTHKKKMDKLQKKLELLQNQIYQLRIPVIIGFEGFDAAGKGGAIKRLTSHLDPRGYVVYPTSAPNDLEKQYHYLWRFWKNMPKDGHISIFDRTWYGRVMVERIEHFCSEEEWIRAYTEINQMEEQLYHSGAVILKFWLHIDKDEQERRFKRRMEVPEKQWKITDEDWRNRKKWEEYEVAVDEMLIRTSTIHAPWIVVEANCKYYARVKVLESVVEALEKKIEEVLSE